MFPRRRISWLAAVGLFILLPAPLAWAQGQQARGKIVGRIVDAETGKALPGAQVVVKGTGIGSLAGVDGRYVIAGVPVGTHDLTITLLGYGEKTITGVQVSGADAQLVDATLAPEAIALTAITVDAKKEQGSVAQALDAQRNATGVISAITSEQIQKSPDRDAAQAVQRVSGVTVQDGRYVFVRGLGERYTTTSLNGARVPSPEPERKVVPLDLFPAGLLQTITTSKTFTPDLSADFSGAHVDIETREFPSRRVLTLQASGGFNGAATGRTVLAAPMSGPEFFGMAGAGRGIPTDVKDPAALERPLTQAQTAQIIRSFRNVWSPDRQGGAPNSSFGFSLGGQAPVAGRSLGYLVSGTYSLSQEARAGEVRSLAVPDGNGGTRPFNEFTGSTGRRSVLWGGLLNLSANVSERVRLTLNNMLDRTADNEAHQDYGILDFFSAPVQRTTLDFVQRTVYSSQLRTQAMLGERHFLDASITRSGVSRDEPDRSDFAYIREIGLTGDTLPLTWLANDDDAAKRSFSTLDEGSWNGALNYRWQLGAVASPVELKTGVAYRTTHRDADTRSYAIVAQGLTPQERMASPEALFDGRYFDGSAQFAVHPVTAGGAYTADEKIAAGFAMVDYPLTPRVHVVAGARVENWKLGLTSAPILRDPGVVDRDNTDVLPSLTLNVKMTEEQNLRLSATQTVSRPEYRELSPITFRDVIGERSMIGNPALRRGLVRNLDARWELYPSRGEVFSVALFAKQFVDPIERVEIATSGASNESFVNADGADNYGVELEARKSLGFLGASLDPLMLFANATLMKSRITPGNDSISALTEASRPMVGQAPYVVNAGATYATDSGLSATVLYNVVGKRITSAGTSPLPDTYEMPRNVLDATLQLPLGGTVTAKLSGKNLLDSPYRQVQGDVTRLRYRAGRVVTLGFNWQP